jgi:hypothetical protein
MNVFLGFFIYLLRGQKEEIVLDIVLEMVFKIKVLKFLMGSGVFVALEIELESMEIFCILILAMENG